MNWNFLVTVLALLSTLLLPAGGFIVPSPGPGFRGSKAPASPLTMSSSSKIEVIHNPANEKLAAMGVADWPTWGCEKSKFPWSYDEKETCYLLAGSVTVTPDGESDGVKIQQGDMAIFPKGMSCTWDVHEAISKHYMFG